MFIELRSGMSIDSADIELIGPVTDITHTEATKHRILIERRGKAPIIDIWPSSAERNLALNNMRGLLDSTKI